jgi:D-alanyl-lipoteichoic acid acyltransferase DltB (MBOAT superfamily)
MFNQALIGNDIHFIDAWCAAIAYTFQIYFDFSAYSEMAIGLSYMLGISLVLNFDSPYKATSMIDHWHRWHITLSRFFRTHIYIPLGGNRKGKLRRYINLFLTTFISGLWHGANWNFVIWGTIHGVYLIINHSWRDLKVKLGINWTDEIVIYRWSCRLLTFTAVVFAFACFRSDGFNVVLSVSKALLNFGDLSVGHYYELAISQLNLVTYLKPIVLGLTPLKIVIALLAITLLWVWLMPNIMSLMYHQPIIVGQKPAEVARHQWSPTIGWSAIAALLAVIALLNLAAVSKFIYFQF